MKKVLVTGASGFIGRHVVSRLKELGLFVVGVSGSGCAVGADISCNVDLLDKNAVIEMVGEYRPEYVINLAGISYTQHNVLEDFYLINVFGAINLLDALKTLDAAPRVLMISSGTVYGAPISGAVTELDCPSPVNHYSVSKLAMEYAVRVYFSSFPIVIVRPFNTTGVGQSSNFVIPKIVSAFKDGLDSIFLGDIDVMRDFSDVRDVASCMVSILLSDVRSEVVNLCSGVGTSLRQVLLELKRISGHDVSIKIDSSLIRSNEVPVLIGSRRKLQDLIDCPKPRPLSETLSWMYQA